MSDRPVFAILGAGNGGLCTAADLTLRGYEVRLFEFPDFAQNLDAVIQKGGIELRGIAGEGFAKISQTTTDINTALDGANIILVIVPAVAHKTAAQTCAAYLNSGQIVILIPGNFGGAIEFRDELISNGGPSNIIIAETTSLMYAAKKENSNGIWARGLKNIYP